LQYEHPPNVPQTARPTTKPRGNDSRCASVPGRSPHRSKAESTFCHRWSAVAGPARGSGLVRQIDVRDSRGAGAGRSGNVESSHQCSAAVSLRLAAGRGSAQTGGRHSVVLGKRKRTRVDREIEECTNPAVPKPTLQRLLPTVTSKIIRLHNDELPANSRLAAAPGRLAGSHRSREQVF